MVYDGIVPKTLTTEYLNGLKYDVKAGLKFSQEEISQLISDLGDISKSFVTIDGKEIDKSNTLLLGIAVSNKMEQLQNQSTTMIQVFSQLFAMEKALTQ